MGWSRRGSVIVGAHRTARLRAQHCRNAKPLAWIMMLPQICHRGPGGTNPRHMLTSSSKLTQAPCHPRLQLGPILDHSHSSDLETGSSLTVRLSGVLTKFPCTPFSLCARPSPPQHPRTAEGTAVTSALRLPRIRSQRCILL